MAVLNRRLGHKGWFYVGGKSQRANVATFSTRLERRRHFYRFSCAGCRDPARGRHRLDRGLGGAGIQHARGGGGGSCADHTGVLIARPSCLLRRSPTPQSGLSAASHRVDGRGGGDFENHRHPRIFPTRQQQAPVKDEGFCFRLTSRLGLGNSQCTGSSGSTSRGHLLVKCCTRASHIRHRTIAERSGKADR